MTRTGTPSRGAVRRRAKAGTAAQTVTSGPRCEACQRLVGLLAQAIHDNGVLRAQFATLEQTLRRMADERGQNRVWE